MMKRTTTAGVLLSLSALGLLWGCGGNGASNNDQGVSVTLLGFYSGLPTTAIGGGAATGGASTCGRLPTPLNRLTLRMGSITESDNTAPTNTDLSSSLLVTIGVQNNLYGQFFRADRMLLEYYIPGSNSQPPSTNVPLTLLAGPSTAGGSNQGGQGGQIGQGGQGGQGGQVGQGGQGTTGNDSELGGSLRRPGNTALPPSFSSLCNQVFSQTAAIPSAVREWISFHRNELPEPPFSMEVYATVAGLSSSGNRIETNTAGFGVDVLPEVIIEPTDGSGDSATATASASEPTIPSNLGGSGSEETL